MLREQLRRVRFADAGRTGKQEYTEGSAHVRESGFDQTDRSTDDLHGLGLSKQLFREFSVECG